MAIRARITPTPETRLELDRLERTDLTPEVKRAIIEATSPAVARVKARIMTMPSNTEGERASLRESLANAVTRMVNMTRYGIMVSIGIAMHGGKENLARAVEGDIPWIHPVYGNSPNVPQTAFPFFTGPVKAATAAVDYKLRSILRRKVD